MNGSIKNGARGLCVLELVRLAAKELRRKSIFWHFLDPYVDNGVVGVTIDVKSLVEHDGEG